MRVTKVQIGLEPAVAKPERDSEPDDDDLGDEWNEDD
jgi:hypothetical protein